MTVLRSFMGPVGGALIGTVAYVSDFKSLPLVIYLSVAGVKYPGMCISAMSNPQGMRVDLWCEPIKGAQNLDALFLGATLIAVFFIAWAGIDLLKKLKE